MPKINSSLRGGLVALGTVLAALAIFFPSAILSAEVRVVADRDYWHTVRPLINGAETSLHFSQLYLNPDRLGNRILADLVQAAERGVAVTALFNHDPEKNREPVRRLREAGAEVVHGGRSAPARLHAKLVIADRERILIGSTNWSGVSMYHNREVNVLVNDAAAAGFYADWIEALQKDPAADPEMDPVETGDWRTVIDREHGEVIAGLLGGASKRAWIGLYAFRTYFGTQHEGSVSDRLARELVRLKEDGVDVRVIIDKSDYNQLMNRINRRTADWFRDQGLEVRFNPPGETAHWKLLVIDDRALVGSMNWGHSGFDLHAEASILLKQPAVVEELAAYFQARWEDSRPPEAPRADPTPVPEGEPVSGETGGAGCEESAR